MEFCKRYKLLHVLPRPGRRIAWSWRTENGTVFRIGGNDTSDDCPVEVVNVFVPAVAVLLALIVFFKGRCGRKLK